MQIIIIIIIIISSSIISIIIIIIFLSSLGARHQSDPLFKTRHVLGVLAALNCV